MSGEAIEALKKARDAIFNAPRPLTLEMLEVLAKLDLCIEELEDIINKSGATIMKREYRCELIGFQDVSNNQFVALIQRLEPHERLGEVKEKQTITSRILRIDFEKKQFETLNSFYLWGEA